LLRIGNAGAAEDDEEVEADAMLVVVVVVVVLLDAMIVFDGLELGGRDCSKGLHSSSSQEE